MPNRELRGASHTVIATFVDGFFLNEPVPVAARRHACLVPATEADPVGPFPVAAPPAAFVSATPPRVAEAFDPALGTGTFVLCAEEAVHDQVGGLAAEATTAVRRAVETLTIASRVPAPVPAAIVLAAEAGHFAVVVYVRTSPAAVVFAELVDVAEAATTACVSRPRSEGGAVL